MEKIKLNDEDREELAKLCHKAQETPLIATDLEAGLMGKDQASLAWNSVRKFIEKLGEKYGFDPSFYSINFITGEVKKDSEIDFENIKYKSGRRF